jgi:hypothetical protein
MLTIFGNWYRRNGILIFQVLVQSYGIYRNFNILCFLWMQLLSFAKEHSWLAIFFFTVQLTFRLFGVNNLLKYNTKWNMISSVSFASKFLVDDERQVICVFICTIYTVNIYYIVWLDFVDLLVFSPDICVKLWCIVDILALEWCNVEL